MGTFGAVASLLAATLYQWYHDLNHELWNFVSTERYILYMQVLQIITHFFLSWNLQNKYEFMESICNWKRSSSSDNICNERVVLTCCRIGYTK